MDNTAEFEARVLKRLAQLGLESFYPELKARGYGDSRAYGVGDSVTKRMRFLARDVGMQKAQLNQFVDNVVRFFATQNRNRFCVAWDPMMAGVLHGVDALHMWEVFKESRLTFNMITCIAERDAVKSLPYWCRRYPEVLPILETKIEQARNLALQVRDLLATKELDG